MSAQLILPLASEPSLTRADFIVAAGNAQAVAFIDSWPSWPVHVAALYGPAGSGKTHLVSIWRSLTGAHVIHASAVEQAALVPGPLAVEDVDLSPPMAQRDGRLFRLIEDATADSPLLLTGRAPPTGWPTVLPDLASRFSALVSLPLWEPDDELLAALARKLLSDRQLSVSDGVIAHILRTLDRTPEDIRNFIAKADAKALSEGRPITLSLVRELIAQIDGSS